MTKVENHLTGGFWVLTGVAVLAALLVAAAPWTIPSLVDCASGQGLIFIFVYVPVVAIGLVVLGMCSLAVFMFSWLY